MPADVAGGGDRGRHTERLAKAATQLVGAAVAAEQWHDSAAVLRDGDDRRLPALVGESGRESPDQYAGGAHPHDVESVREQPAQLGADVAERNVHVGHTGGISVDAGLGQARPDPSGHGRAPLRQHHDGDRVSHSTSRAALPTPRRLPPRGLHALPTRSAPRRPPSRGLHALPTRSAPRSPRRHTFHALPRACSRIMEKYGAASPPTSASGRIFSLAMVACST